MLSLVAATLLLQSQEPTIIRDSYGVPMLKANTANEAFRLMGQAVAEDRLWQLEMSRRTSLGQMSEVLGPQYVASDQATLGKQYTEDEYKQMLAVIPESTLAAWEAYVAGINDTIKKRTADSTLPEGYKTNDFEPRPWTLTDSAAIMVNLSRQFGQGGAGELRNYALVQYLRTRPAVKDRLLDALDDLAWQNEPNSPVTVEKRDDTVLRIPEIFSFTRAESEAHLASLPPTNLLELASAIRLASMEDQKLVAEANSVPFKAGSYAVVVSPRRSSTGYPMLLTAPQMGHASPSIVHEVAFDTPQLKVAGMDVPGIPGVIIGYTPDAAWGFTSGVGDLEDIFVSPIVEGNTYLHQGQERELEEVKFTLKVKGQPDKEFTQYRTAHGPVLLKSNASKAVYSLNSAFWKKEIASCAALFGLYSAKTPSDFTAFAATIPVSFNLFFATKQGDIGYRYCGYVPIRARGVDPRLPTPDTAANQWKGFVSNINMPRSDNPDSGLITNWNNKPVAWWPNGDTPVWGRYFRSANIGYHLQLPKLSPANVADIVRTNASEDHIFYRTFWPTIQWCLSGDFSRTGTLAEAYKKAYPYLGKNTDGDIAPTVVFQIVSQLRKELFSTTYGNFTSDALFEQILQHHIMVDALEGKTKIDYLGGRTKIDVVKSAVTKAVDSLIESRGSDVSQWGYRAPALRYPGQDPVLYSNRGTYIQLTEFGEFWPSARSVAAPGVTESGPNSVSQAPLARNWQYKVMWGWE